jgi:RNA polymerase sigma-70 factor (ECF subfamily)
MKCTRRNGQLNQIEATGFAYSDMGIKNELHSDFAITTNKVCSEEELETISAILNGEPHKFQDLIRPYVRGTYAMALRMLKNQADAEDATQEAFLKAYCCLSRFRGDSRFSTWLYTILLNESRSRLRRNAKVRLESFDIDPWDMGLTLADPTDNPAQALDRNETCTLLRDAIGKLPQKYREVFHLREEKGFSVRETADLLAITAETVKVRLHRARALLRNRLAPHFHMAKHHVSGQLRNSGALQY